MSRGAVGRRPVLAGGLGIAVTGALVACGSDEDSSANGSGSGDSGDSGSGDSGDSGDSGSGDSGDDVIVAVADVPVGGAVSAKDGSGEPIIVAQPEAGTIVAFTAVCTHKQCKVRPEGTRLKCPCHESVFEAFTGANVSGPAPSPLASVPVTVSGDNVVPG